MKQWKAKNSETQKIKHLGKNKFRKILGKILKEHGNILKSLAYK